MDTQKTIRSLGKTTPRPLHEADKVEEELEGFIRVYRDGSVERFSYVVPNVSASDKPDQGCMDATYRKDAWIKLISQPKTFTERMHG